MTTFTATLRPQEATTQDVGSETPPPDSGADSQSAPSRTAGLPRDDTPIEPQPLFCAKQGKPELGKEQFRILRVHPAREGDEVRADLVEYNINDEVDFEAVSYTWGPPSDDPVSLNQEPYIKIGDRHHRITWSVRHALDVFRLTNDTRNLWIDQICIDQTDDEEKSAQVPLMGQIFRRATGTLIWLGPHDDHLIAAAANIKLFGNLRRQIVAVVDLNPSLSKARRLSAVLDLLRRTSEEQEKHEITGQRSLLSKLDGAEIAQILDLYSNPWFVRTWPLQEVVLSKNKTAYIGHFSIDYEDLGLFTSWYIQHYHKSLPSARRLRGLRIVRYVYRFAVMYGKGIDLCSLLSIIRRFDVKEPKDKVFALLAMVNFGLRSDGSPYPDVKDSYHPRHRVVPAPLRPDYSKSDAEVFLETAKYQLNRDKSVHFLAFVRHPPSPTAFLRTPSWVPWWNDPDEAQDPLWRPGDDDDEHLADSTVHTDVSFDERLSLFDPQTYVQTCMVWGVEIGRVKRASLPFPSSLRGTRTRNIIGSEIETRMKEQKESGSSLSPKTTWEISDTLALLEELIMALTAGSTTVPGPSQLVTNIRKGEEAADGLVQRQMRGFVGWISKLPDQDPKPEYLRALLKLQSQVQADDPGFLADDETIRAVMSRVRNSAGNRCLFRTDTGMLGLGPSCTRVGDVVVVLRTGPVPFVLRAEEDCGSEYQVGLPGTQHLVGNCYVYRAMDGEFAEKVEKEAVQFTLV